ncbi:MAG: UDP-N-acetylmuramate: L-alanyl-gamma-D-glutamyl-meso-diaminopimelate ligase, partial [Myxococcota bacterium]
MTDKGLADSLEVRCTPEHLASARRVHVMGVCGTAMGTFAGMLKSRGYEVRGSDTAFYPPMSDLLAEWNIPTMQGYQADNLDWKPDLVVVGNVIRRTNPEAIAMRERGLPHVSFPEAFGTLFLEGRHPVVITGTHGKTSTTALTAFLLREGALDPTLLVGGVPLDFGASFVLGTGDHVVVEGDEYDTAYFDKVPKFVHYRPQTAVITNIEFDHADIYRDIEHIQGEFDGFARLLPAAGRLLYWSGSERATRAAKHAQCKTESYGAPDAWWRAEDVEETPQHTQFTLWRGPEVVGRATAPLFGPHNIQNAVAALGIAIGLGVPSDRAFEALSRFRNVKKRHEIKGVAAGVTVIDDFAHHPTAVRATVAAVRRRFAEGRLFCCFEIESNTSRRKVFQDEYPPAFEGADAVLFCKPLAKADSLPLELRIDLGEVCRQLEQRDIEAHLIPEVPDMVRWLVDRVRPGDVVLGMSGRH